MVFLFSLPAEAAIQLTWTFRQGMTKVKEFNWQFDRGLWSVNNDFRVVVNREKFIEEGVPGQRLADFEGRRIFLPSDPNYWPEHAYLDWHCKRHGFPSQANQALLS